MGCVWLKSSPPANTSTPPRPASPRAPPHQSPQHLNDIKPRIEPELRLLREQVERMADVRAPDFDVYENWRRRQAFINKVETDAASECPGGRAHTY